MIELGAAALSDAELVAIHLGSGRAGASAMEVARQLLAECGGVAALALAQPQELARHAGIGPAKAARLVAACALASRIATASTQNVRLLTSADIAGIVIPRLGGARVEQVAVVVADSGSRLLRVEVVATGSAKSCPMPVREVLAAVLRHDGVAFGVAHNHPGGDATPTAADVRATDALRAAAEATGLRFLDHVVVTATDWRSVTMSRGPSAP